MVLPQVRRAGDRTRDQGRLRRAAGPHVPRGSRPEPRGAAAFVLGLSLAGIFHRHAALHRRFRVVAFALLTPFFFLKGGLSVSLPLVWANAGALGLLFAVKLAAKFAGVYPFARRYAPADAVFSTLLMSTGLTFGTIASLYGLNAGILDSAQFSVLVATIVASAVIPTVVAQRWFFPKGVVAPPDASGIRVVTAEDLTDPVGE